MDLMLLKVEYLFATIKYYPLPELVKALFPDSENHGITDTKYKFKTHMNAQQKFIMWLAPRIATVIIKWRGNRYHFEKAIKQAEKLASSTFHVSYNSGGRRTYIYFIGGKYRALNRKQIQYWRNHTKGVRTGLKVSQMVGIQLYDTQGHVNSHPTYTNMEVKGIDIIYKRFKDLK